MRLQTRMLMLSIVATTASTLANADPVVNVRTEVVRYDDVRIVSTVGAAVLYARLRAAAERVCAPPSGSPKYRACVDSALEAAVTDVNHPILTHYADTKRGTAAQSPNKVQSPSTVAQAR